MDIFEKTAKTVKNASESVISSAKNIGISLYSSTKEQGELAGLNVQKSAIEKKLTDCYTEIGKRYVEYIANCNSGTAFFNVADILESMQPEFRRKKYKLSRLQRKRHRRKLRKSLMWRRRSWIGLYNWIFFQRKNMKLSWRQLLVS